MAMLTGPEIARQVAAGRIAIDPFDPARVGSNSYDLTLSPDLLVYVNNLPVHDIAAHRAAGRHGVAALYAAGYAPLDTAADEPTVALRIPPEGLVLWPGVLYLGSTVERTATPDHVPCISGRSTVGRYGIAVHCTAGYGDNFFGCGPAGPCAWTLEITAQVPVRVYAGTRICQVYYTELVGEKKPYSGKYNAQTGPQSPGLCAEFGPGKEGVTRG